MSNVLSNSPTFTPTSVTVDRFSFPAAAAQPGGSEIETNDARILNAEWRGGRLVASQDVSVAADNYGTARARWYEFDTTGAAPTALSTNLAGVILTGDSSVPRAEISISSS